MPRTSDGPRYYKSKKGWFANIGGERIPLVRGPKKQTEEEAKEKYRAEVEARKVEVAGDRSSVWSVLNAYLVDLQNRVKNEDAAENTLKMNTAFIEPFSERFGTMQVRQLRRHHVDAWLAEMRQPRWHEKLKRELKWGDRTAKIAVDVLRGAFTWAVGEELLSRSPFDRGKKKREKRKKRRPAKSRVAILPAEHELLLEQARRRTKKDFYHLLLFLHRTGARPAEMYLAKASEWDEPRKAFVIKATPKERGRYKLAHLKEDRVIHIPDDMVPLARELMAKHPTGPLFLTGRGKPWTKDSLCGRFSSTKAAANRAAERQGLPPVRKELTAYSYRHGFVTRWVKQNRPLWKLCELLNTSEAMIRHHYSHLFEQTECLREALNDFDQDRAAPLASPTSPAVEPAGLAS